MKTIACCTWSVDAPELWQACHSSIVTDGVLCRRFIGPLIQCLIKASRSVTDSTEVDQTCWEKHQNIFLVTDLWSYSLHQSWTWPKRLVRINWNCIGYQFRLCNLCRTMYDWNWCWLNTCNTYFVSNSLQQFNWLIIMTCVSGNCCNTSTCTDNARFCRRCLVSMLARASSSGNLAVWGWSCGDANGHGRKSQGFFTCYWTFWLLEISNIVNLSRSPETEAKIVTCRSGRAFMKCSRTCFHVFRPFQLCKVLKNSACRFNEALGKQMCYTAPRKPAGLVHLGSQWQYKLCEPVRFAMIFVVKLPEWVCLGFWSRSAMAALHLGALLWRHVIVSGDWSRTSFSWWQIPGPWTIPSKHKVFWKCWPDVIRHTSS